jgi:hypothetical protein
MTVTSCCKEFQIRPADSGGEVEVSTLQLTENTVQNCPPTLAPECEVISARALSVPKFAVRAGSMKPDPVVEALPGGSRGPNVLGVPQHFGAWTEMQRVSHGTDTCPINEAGGKPPFGRASPFRRWEKGPEVETGVSILGSAGILIRTGSMRAKTAGSSRQGAISLQ